MPDRGAELARSENENAGRSLHQEIAELSTKMRQIAGRLQSANRTDLEDLIEAKWLVTDVLNEAVSPGPGRDIEFMTKDWPAQSRCFVVDMFEELQGLLLSTFKRSDTIRLLDVGAATGAGPSLLGELFSSHILWRRIEVDAIDLTDRTVLLSRNNYRDFNYLVGDIFQLAPGSYDIVTCSHVIEHVNNNLEEFISQIRRITKRYAILYAPYAEVNPIPAHVNIITEETFSSHSPKSIRIMRSLGWRAGNPDYNCILAILPPLGPE